MGYEPQQEEDWQMESHDPHVHNFVKFFVMDDAVVILLEKVLGD